MCNFRLSIVKQKVSICWLRLRYGKRIVRSLRDRLSSRQRNQTRRWCITITSTVENKVLTISRVARITGVSVATISKSVEQQPAGDGLQQRPENYRRTWLPPERGGAQPPFVKEPIAPGTRAEYFNPFLREIIHGIRWCTRLQSSLRPTACAGTWPFFSACSSEDRWRR